MSTLSVRCKLLIFLNLFWIYSLPVLAFRLVENEKGASESFENSYKLLMQGLRENWQSPIAYLKSRGYLPAESELETLLDSNDGTQKLEENNDSPNEQPRLITNLKKKDSSTNIASLSASEKYNENPKDVIQNQLKIKEKEMVVKSKRSHILQTIRNKIGGVFSRNSRTSNVDDFNSNTGFAEKSKAKDFKKFYHNTDASNNLIQRSSEIKRMSLDKDHNESKDILNMLTNSPK